MLDESPPQALLPAAASRRLPAAAHPSCPFPSPLCSAAGHYCIQGAFVGDANACNPCKLLDAPATVLCRPGLLPSLPRCPPTPSRPPVGHRDLAVVASPTRTRAGTRSRTPAGSRSRTPLPTRVCPPGEYTSGAGCTACPAGFSDCGVVWGGTCDVGYVAVASTPGAPGFPGLTCGACIAVTPTSTVTPAVTGTPTPSKAATPSKLGTRSATHTAVVTGTPSHSRAMLSGSRTAVGTGTGTRSRAASRAASGAWLGGVYRPTL